MEQYNNPRMIQPFFALSDLVFLALRVIIAVLLFRDITTRRKNAAPGSRAAAFRRLFTVCEFVAGIFILAGFLTQIAALFTILLIVVLRVRKESSLFTSNPVTALLAVALLLALVAVSGGAWSVDQFFGIILY